MKLLAIFHSLNLNELAELFRILHATRGFPHYCGDVLRNVLGLSICDADATTDDMIHWHVFLVNIVEAISKHYFNSRLSCKVSLDTIEILD